MLLFLPGDYVIADRHALQKDRESYQTLKNSFTHYSDNIECLGRVVIAAASYSAIPSFKPRPGNNKPDDFS